MKIKKAYGKKKFNRKRGFVDNGYSYTVKIILDIG